jgi:hypothetical protein
LSLAGLPRRDFDPVSEILDDTIADRAPLSANTAPSEEQKIGGEQGEGKRRRAVRANAPRARGAVVWV